MRLALFHSSILDTNDSSNLRNESAVRNDNLGYFNRCQCLANAGMISRIKRRSDFVGIGSYG